MGERLGRAHPALEIVTLLVSEAVTNSIVHSDSKNGGKITLAIADCHDFIHVDVVDAGGKEVPRVRDDELGEGGRGLQIVQALAYRWDVHEDATSRTVWFQVKYEGANDASRALPRQQESTDPGETALKRTARRAAWTVAESLAVERARARRFEARWGRAWERPDVTADSRGGERFLY
ncbi:ATP-binding protein [Sphaerisporangium sp. NPDC051011]|uniref:ATP-binding protein n=1 Tax=Sphaerisporangium sp. NPDC051011 TaxID=3155792 RepID=UPI0033F4897F